MDCRIIRRNFTLGFCMLSIKDTTLYARMVEGETCHICITVSGREDERSGEATRTPLCVRIRFGASPEVDTKTERRTLIISCNQVGTTRTLSHGNRGTCDETGCPRSAKSKGTSSCTRLLQLNHKLRPLRDGEWS